MAGILVRKCPCLRPKIEEEVRVLDYRHSSLTDVPGDVFNFERTLEELYTDSNQIRDLPRELFYCHGLRKLSISDNEITSIPPAIASLDYLEELDFSKNGIIDVPDNIKCCKYLRVIEASVNPLGKLPEGFTQLQNLTQLYLNDTFLDYLPGSFGRLVKLRILEIRENHLKTLPKSFGRLTELERLDIGNNEFTDLPDVIGSLTNLLELWCDNNQITTITHTIGALKQLMFLDASKNQLETLPGEIEGCICLADLHLTGNRIKTLPDSIGNLSNLTTLKVDDNHLTSLPRTLGGLASLSELNVSVNDLEELPASVGLLRNLRTFYADENFLSYVPAELGSCSGITVLSLRSNKLTYIPDELGRIPRLRVLNLSDNCLSYLPFTIVKLKELQALWLTENQTRPLIPLQSEYEPDTGRKILTCYLLPQGQHSDNDEHGGDGDTDSFHPSIWDEERLRRQQIHFNFADDDEEEGHLVRCPTPYPKEMREKARHMRNLAMRQSLGDGAQPTSWSPHPDNSIRVQQESKGNYSYGPGDGTGDVRVREARITKPHSPSLQETHRLYRFDKEKLLKDKARMQHRTSMPNITDDMSPVMSRSRKRGGRGGSGSDVEDGPGRLSGRRKSAPNLFAPEDQGSEAEQQRHAFTYEDLYQKQLLHQHHHRHGRRSRRMREYDSDTGYRSDQDYLRFQRRFNDDDRHGHSDSMSVRSQPTMSRPRRGARGREAGYASDLEVYAGMGRGVGGRSGGGTPSSRPPILQLYTAHSVPHNLNAQTPPSGHMHSVASPLSSSQSRLATPDSNHVNRPNSASLPPAAPSPTQLGSNKILDQSTPVTAHPPQAFPSPTQTHVPGGVYSQSSGHADRELHRELYTVLEERNRKPAAPPPVKRNPSPTTAKLQGNTPPPYQPAPPYHRTPSTRSDQSDEQRSAQASPRDSGSKGGYPSNSFSNPEYTAVRFVDRDRSGDSKVDGGGGDERGSGYSREYQTVAMVHQPPDGQYSHSGQQQQQQSHSRQQQPLSGQQQPPQQLQQRTNLYPYNDEGRTRRRDGELSLDTRVADQFVGPDYSVTSHSGSGGSFHPPYSTYDHQSSPGASSHSDRVTDRSSDSLTTASRQLDLSVTARRSPHHLDLSSSSSSRERSGSRGNVFNGRMNSGALTPQKPFEAYPNPYGEPLEAGDPLMMRYEDVAMFKSAQDPSSQVSSSTDSGYGHGHHIYERIGDLQMRRSGSPQSSTPPSHRNTPVRRNSSSQGTPSRETTPVKEEGFYSVQGHVLSESTTQESRDVFRAVIRKNPGLGFSIAGGHGSRGNPFRDGDMGIFVTKVLQEGPAATVLQPGDKILQVNHIDFRSIDHLQAVNVMKTSSTVELLVERIQKVNLV
nr:hypothetical protein BaRGS_020463 [Batillaria attramentaria]